MTNVQLHAVPTDDRTPFPLSLDRVQSALTRLDLGTQVMTNQKLQVTVDGQPFLLCLKTSSSGLSIRTFWDTEQPHEQVEDRLFAAADTWNRERYFPTVYILSTDRQNAQVVADYVTLGRGGLSNQQLDAVLQIAITTGVDAIRFMQDAAWSVLGMTDAPFWQ